MTSPFAHAGPAPSTHSWQFFDQLHSSPNRCVFATTTPISRAESASGLINMMASDTVVGNKFDHDEDGTGEDTKTLLAS